MDIVHVPNDNHISGTQAKITIIGASSNRFQLKLVPWDLCYSLINWYD